MQAKALDQWRVRRVPGREVQAWSFRVSATILAAFTGWIAALPTATAVAVAAIAGLALVPAAFLLSGAIVLNRGLGVDVVGPLVAVDLMLLVWLARSLLRRDRFRPSYTDLWLAMFVVWCLISTLYVGISVSPLLRITVYAAVFVVLAHFGTGQQSIYIVVLGYALINLVGGVLQGQSRLLGLDVGDPAQMGALILAALCPILAGDLRFPGQWVIASVLVYGIWLTQTRSVWFAAIVLAAVWTQRRMSTPKLVAIVGAMALVGFKLVKPLSEALGLNMTSGDIRAETIANGIRSGIENPLFGTGWANASLMGPYGTATHPIEGQALPYNLFVNVFMSVGAPGLILLVLFLLGLLKRLMRRRQAPLFFVTAVLALSITEMTIYAGSTLTLLLFIYAGIGYYCAGDDRPDGAKPRFELHPRRRTDSSKALA